MSSFSLAHLARLLLPSRTDIRSLSVVARSNELHASLVDLRHLRLRERWPQFHPTIAAVRRRLSISDELTNSVNALVAIQADRIVGEAHVLTVREEPRFCRIQIFVLPEHRRRGIATSLLRQSVSEARRRGYHGIGCSTASFAAGGAAMVAAMHGATERIIHHFEVPISGPDDDGPYGRALVKSNESIKVGVTRSCDASNELIAATEELQSILRENYGHGVSRIPPKVRAEMRRQHYTKAFALGQYAWIAHAQVATASYIGVNEYSWDEEIPDVLCHDGISVLHRYRGTDVVQRLIRVGRNEILGTLPGVRAIRCARQLRVTLGSATSSHDGWYERRWRVPLSSAITYTKL